jgi:hypothetical protein
MMYRLLRSTVWLLAAAALAGCASLATPPALDKASTTPELQACADWYTALDTATDAAGVRDAGAVRVPGFAHLRVDRFTASLRDALAAGTDASVQARQAALLQRLRQLDLEARSHEIANLPAQARTRLLASTALGQATVSTTTSSTAAQTSAAALQRTQTCAARLAAHDAASPERMASLQQRLQVPDDYATSYRVLGVYALSRYPFAAGVRNMEAERLAVFATDSPTATGSTRLRYAPPAGLPGSRLGALQIARMLAPLPGDPLRVPAPSNADLERLFAQFAPSFEIDTASNDDKPGTLVWRPGSPGSPDGARPMLELDTTAPALYRQVAYTRYEGRNLLQLVYTLWFAARPPAPGSSFDMLAGKLDGVVWRVTLAPDGTPLVADTIHPCGCYHMFFPSPGTRTKSAPQKGIEWAFSPAPLPSLSPQDRVVLRIAARTHYVDRVSAEPVPAAGSAPTVQSATRYAWQDYHSLRSLPLNALPAASQLASTLPADSPVTGVAERRSLFSPTGFIDGTDRAERWVFWPMGIERAGTMRQWGKHATAFVGRRHFDDATLLEQRFEFDPVHFGNPLTPQQAP